MSAELMSGQAFLTEIALAFEKQKSAAEKAMAQIDDAAFFWVLGESENSVAIIAKHMAGNLVSRFTEFLTTDGEKPDRNRDGEFEVERSETRASVMTTWGRGWTALFDTLRALGGSDLERTIYIRGEPATVQQALLRALAHQAQHAGQIVLLAKHLAGDRWETLSIPRRRKR